MPSSTQELINLLPYLIIGGGIVLAVIIEMYSKKSEEILPWFSIAVLALAGCISVLHINEVKPVFGGAMTTGGIASAFNIIFCLGSALVILSSIDYVKVYGAYYGEYYIIMLSAILGMMIMAGSQDLFMVFIGLELMSICFYVLAGLNRKKQSANESSLKYFLLGSFATGFIVMGIAFLYGSVGSVSIPAITEKFSSLTSNYIFLIGMMLFLVGFSFKIAAFPFHMWAPDVYQGAPTTVSGLMATGGKTAAFSVLLVALTAIFTGKSGNIFQPYFAVIALASMVYGSITAISQNNIKRMLAYSSIAHAGYMAIGLAAGNQLAVSGIIYYLAAYTFMNLGAFGIASMIESEDDKHLDLDSYAGLSSRRPALAALMAIFMFGLAGIPPFAGFFGKYYVFLSAIEAGLTWLAIVGVLASVVSVYFYLRVVVIMYFKEPAGAVTERRSGLGLTAAAISALLIIALGVYPGTLIDMLANFVK
jgi:NADH-quinone oxidoreductase subunit N